MHSLNFSSVNSSLNRRNISSIPPSSSALGVRTSYFCAVSQVICCSLLYLLCILGNSYREHLLYFSLCGPLVDHLSQDLIPAIHQSYSWVETQYPHQFLRLPHKHMLFYGFHIYHTTMSFTGLRTTSNHMHIRIESFHALYWLVITCPVSS